LPGKRPQTSLVGFCMANPLLLIQDATANVGGHRGGSLVSRTMIDAVLDGIEDLAAVHVEGN